jgi:hypothetical protein
VEWLLEQLAPSLPKLFVPLDVQLANYRRWNTERNLGITDAEFDAIDLSGPWYHGGLVVDVIVGYLRDQGGIGGIQRTFEETWDIASSRQPRKSRYKSLQSDPEHLCLLEGIEHTRGLRRVTVDLGANRDMIDGISPRDVRGKDSAQAEILAAAAQFPGWVQAMNGKNVPYVWMPGYQVLSPVSDAWQRLPYILWDWADRAVHLVVTWDDKRSSGWACPEVVRR